MVLNIESNMKSGILGIGGAPGARETFQKSAGLRPPTFLQGRPSSRDRPESQNAGFHFRPYILHTCLPLGEHLAQRVLGIVIAKTLLCTRGSLHFGQLSGSSMTNLCLSRSTKSCSGQETR